MREKHCETYCVFFLIYFSCASFSFQNDSSLMLFDVNYYSFHIILFYFFVFFKNLIFGML
jgi:hypothetical protein